ncbi:MAG: hypothetical protein U1F68_13390 [Gammaproteobacteria bacterium]
MYSKLDPALIDAANNVHPAGHEVRFREACLAHDLRRSASGCISACSARPGASAMARKLCDSCPRHLTLPTPGSTDDRLHVDAGAATSAGFAHPGSLCRLCRIAASGACNKLSGARDRHRPASGLCGRAAAWCVYPGGKRQGAGAGGYARRPRAHYLREAESQSGSH